MDPAATIPAFDAFLAERAWPFVANYEGNPESREVYWLPLAQRQLARLGKELGYDAVF